MHARGFLGTRGKVFGSSCHDHMSNMSMTRVLHVVTAGEMWA